MLEKGEDKPATSEVGARKSSGGASSSVKANNESNEKSTLGDLDALAALKSEMEGGK